MVRAVVVVAAAAAALAGAGCPAEDPCLSIENEPAFGGLGNDEVWLTLADAKENATQANDSATIVAPAADATLPADTAPVFEWESPLKLSLGPQPPPSAPYRRAPRSFIDSLIDRAIDGARDVVIPSALAHLPPVTSDAYLVDVVVPGRECPVSIVTTELSHQLDDETWSLIKGSAGAELRMDITSAYLFSGRIQEGPFAATSSVTFRVE